MEYRRRTKGVIRNGWKATLEYDRDSEQLVAKRIVGANQENVAELIIQARETHGRHNYEMELGRPIFPLAKF